RHEVEDEDAGGEKSRRDEDPHRAEGAPCCRTRRRRHRRRLRGAQHGVRGNEPERQSPSDASACPGASGRLRIPSRVTYFDHASPSAGMSSGTKRGDAFPRATTAPGTSPSSISCSMRMNVSVNSYWEKLTFAKFEYVPPMSSVGI